MKKYFIGSGTRTVAQFDTLQEMLAFHSKMEPLARHFCKLYDTANRKLADGCDILSSGSSAWRPAHH